MAKALINKGIPIKADDPKDPYIRDEAGIKAIVDSSKVFGKTLGTANGKIQLKNGNKVLSEVGVFEPYTETQVQISGGSEIDTFTIPNTYNGSDMSGPFEVEKYYHFWSYGGDISAYDTLTVVNDFYNPTTTLKIDCSNINDDIDNIYFKVTAINGGIVSAIGYASQPTEKVYYNKAIKLGSNLTIVDDTLNTSAPDLSDYGKTLAISGQNLSLKNGDTVLSTVTIPSSGGGGGSSAGVSTYTANFSNNAYYLDSSAVATEIFNKLNDNEDVQIVLVKDGNKHIARCTGYSKGVWDEDEQEWMTDPSYHFSCIVYDLSFIVIAFDLSSGDNFLDITEHGLN